MFRKGHTTKNKDVIFFIYQKLCFISLVISKSWYEFIWATITKMFTQVQYPKAYGCNDRISNSPPSEKIAKWSILFPQPYLYARFTSS